jgi:prepilin-type N-terminal cleavage/methylation domain-containing protein
MRPSGNNGEKSKDGFTLIELMVIVAIMAILAGISIPQYQKMVNKGNQQGAVAALTSVYMAEKNFAAENHTYTACLNSIGISQPPGNAPNWYTYGFDGGNLQASCGPNGGYNCNVSAWDEGAAVASCAPNAGTAGTDWFSATVSNSAVLPNNAGFLGTVSTDMTNTTFTARATGALASGVGAAASAYDKWYINEGGTPVNNLNNL